VHQLPKYDPPQFNPQMEGNLNDRVKSFFMFWGNVQQYLYNYLNNFRFVLQSESTSPYAAVPAAATIAPSRHIQPVSGTATISTIQAAPDFHQVTLLAVNGFSLATGSNIAAAKTLTAGQAVTLSKNFLDGLFYPS
jgi:hypothetical protein